MPKKYTRPTKEARYERIVRKLEREGYKQGTEEFGKKFAVRKILSDKSHDRMMAMPEAERKARADKARAEKGQSFGLAKLFK